MFLGINMLNLYVSICYDNPEVVMIDRDVIGTRSHFLATASVIDP